MAKNPHFRVLALSATPGSDPEKVQSIIDHLHISRIEIRDESSMDLREYMFTKVSVGSFHHPTLLPTWCELSRK
jgi:ATP-dependent DNA helicase MPH1